MATAMSSPAHLMRGKTEGYKQNPFEKYVNIFCVQNDMNHKILAEKLDCRPDQLSTLIRLQYPNQLLFNKLIDFMDVAEEDEELFSTLFDEVAELVKKITLTNYPPKVAKLLFDITKNHLNFTDKDLARIQKIVSDNE